MRAPDHQAASLDPQMHSVACFHLLLRLHEAGLAPPPKQGSRTPRGGDAEHQDESRADPMICGCTLAPALEHCSYSNDKQHDCASGKTLQQHDLIRLSPGLNQSRAEPRSIVLYYEDLCSDLSHPREARPKRAHSPCIEAPGAWDISQRYGPLPIARTNRRWTHGPMRSAA